MLVFSERGKPECPRKNLYEQSREPTNSTHMGRRVRKSNPGHIGGRQCSDHCAKILSNRRVNLQKNATFHSASWLHGQTVIFVITESHFPGQLVPLHLKRMKQWNVWAQIAPAFASQDIFECQKKAISPNCVRKFPRRRTPRIGRVRYINIQAWLRGFNLPANGRKNPQYC